MPITIEDNQVYFDALAGDQANFLDCWGDCVALFGGLGSGKTFAGSCKAVMSCLRYPGFDGMAIAPTHNDLESYVIPALLERFEEIGIEAHHRRYLFFIEYRFYTDEGPVIGKIYLRSGEKPERITGVSVAWVWIDEACRIPESDEPTKDVKTQAIGRMRGKELDDYGGGILFITSTHEGLLTWPYRDFIENPKPGHTCFTISTLDNFYVGRFAQFLQQQYDKKLVRQYVYGEAVSVNSILAYYAFNPAPWPEGNLDDSIQIDFYREVCLSMDFNSNPGCHGVVGQFYPERDEFLIVDEIHRKGMNIPSLIAEYVKRYGSGEKKPVTCIYGDSTGQGRDPATGVTSYNWVSQSMQDHGLYMVERVPRAAPFQEDRMISVNSAFEDGKGRHVRIHPQCKKLIADLNIVRRDESGRLDKKMEKKGYVHISDALGYFIHKERQVGRITVSGFFAGRG